MLFKCNPMPGGLEPATGTIFMLLEVAFIFTWDLLLPRTMEAASSNCRQRLRKPWYFRLAYIDCNNYYITQRKSSLNWTRNRKFLIIRLQLIILYNLA
jgi:hypothetical protein